MNKYNNHGFTLLELMIALSLVGLLLVMLYGSFNLGVASWDKGEARADRLNQIRLTQEFLRRQLRQSLTVFRSDPSDGRVLYFIGEGARIGWVAPMLRYLGMGGLYHLELDRVGDDDNGQLRLRWYPYNPANEDEVIDSDAAEQTILLEGVTGFAVEYFGPREFNAESEWQKEWENPQERPLLIKIKLALADIDWPELIVPVLN